MNFVINLDKPKGMTSQEAVTAVKKIFRAKKAGHAGTLDPIATGILLVCLNEATKITGFLSDLDKEYIATMRLGQRTDTLDAEGSVIESKEGITFTESEIEAVLRKFLGQIKQTPPMYSAIKRSGMPLYKLARKGIEVQRQARTVEIYALSLIKLEIPFAKVRISCSKGTYIRSLADDIGRELAVGAHITELKRTRVGHFAIEDSASMDELPGKESSINTMDFSLGHLDEIVLTGRDFTLASKGTQIPVPEPLGSHTGFLRLKDPDGTLFGVGRVSGGRLWIERLLFNIRGSS